MPINYVAGSPTARAGKLARAARMWWTPEQGGLPLQYRASECTLMERGVDWQERLHVELNDLKGRIADLGAFVGSDAFQQLSFPHRDMLYRQLQAMNVYCDILVERIATVGVQMTRTC